MKRLIKKLDPAQKVIKIVCEYVVEVSEECYQEEGIAAATYKGFYIPEGSLLPGEKAAVIDSQAWADYCSFIDSVDDLIKDYYGLEVYYKNRSDDYSVYWGLLAKNEDESLIIDFTLSLRVSNHEAHRSAESKFNKKKQEEMLLKRTGGIHPRVMTKHVLVNDKKYKDYMEAYLEVDRIIERALKIMTRRNKKR